MIKAVGFDVGHTLIKYDNPLNLGSIYRPALEQVIKNCNIKHSEEKVGAAISILTKYNTRVNPREIEVSSDVIFDEIFDSWTTDSSLIPKAKEAFYSFIQATAVPYEEVETVLSILKSCNIKIGVLTNVAYGMDNKFSLKDIDTISQYIDIVFSSVDVGFRKPNSTGYKLLMEAFNVEPDEMLFVGDEEIDIVGANRLGIGSVLINRGSKELSYGQKFTISSLNGILDILHKQLTNFIP